MVKLSKIKVGLAKPLENSNTKSYFKVSATEPVRNYLSNPVIIHSTMAMRSKSHNTWIAMPKSCQQNLEILTLTQIG